MTMMKVAIIGTGRVAQGNYLPCLAAEPDVELGYFSRTRVKAEACAQKYGGQVFSSLQALIEWQPTTVFILTRETDRFEVANALLQLDPARIFFEKPLVAHHGQENVTEEDFVDGRKILQLAQEKCCETAMVFNYRFFEHSQIARRMVMERDFGKVLNVTGLVHYACWSHCIDLIHFFAGPLAQVTALQGQTVHASSGMSAQDVTLAFRTDQDATGTLIGTTTLAWDYPLFELSFNFERGRIRMQDLDGDLEVMDAHGMEVERFHIYGAHSRWDQYNNSFVKSVKAYLESLRKNEPPPVPGVFGLLELQVEAAIKRSIALSRPVKLAEEFPLI
jgi:predicted dehydrogenase